jgi:hypothetical protein
MRRCIRSAQLERGDPRLFGSEHASAAGRHRDSVPRYRASAGRQTLRARCLQIRIRPERIPPHGATPMQTRVRTSVDAPAGMMSSTTDATRITTAAPRSQREPDIVPTPRPRAGRHRKCHGQTFVNSLGCLMDGRVPLWCPCRSWEADAPISSGLAALATSLLALVRDARRVGDLASASFALRLGRSSELLIVSLSAGRRPALPRCVACARCRTTRRPRARPYPRRPGRGGGHRYPTGSRSPRGRRGRRPQHVFPERTAVA